MTPDEFAALSVDDKHALSERERPGRPARWTKRWGTLRAIEREVVEAMQTMDRSVVEAIVKGPFDTLAGDYREYEEVARFLDQLARIHAEQRRSLAPDRGAASDAPRRMPPGATLLDPFLAFRVNLFVDNSETEGPPIIVEPNPTWTNLFGRIDRRAYLGTYLSDHTMLKPGAAHRANGGYLILSWTDVADAARRLGRH